MIIFVVMIQVEDIIGELLLRHNCVIIPGFGGFVAKQTSARIDYKNGVMTPPGKSILFNRQLISNDGLIVTEYALKNGFSFNQAQEEIQFLIAKWNLELSAGNRVSIDKVGYLFYDQERNICFEQDRFVNLLLSSYGLKSLHFLSDEDVEIAQHRALVEEQKVASLDAVQPVVNTKVSEVIEPLFVLQDAVEVEVVQPVIAKMQVNDQEIEDISPSTTRIKKSNTWKYIAAACILPLLFYSFWIPMKTDVLESKIISFSDFNPFHKKVNSLYEKKSVKEELNIENKKSESLKEQLSKIESGDETYSYNLSSETFLLVTTDKAPEVVVDKIEQVSTTPISNTVAADKYHYIVGCFSDAVNAELLVKELKSKGFNALVKDKKGSLHRVSIGGANNQEDLTALIGKATAAGFDGWVLK